MPSEYVGAVDQGTTGTRFILFDREGGVVSDAYAKHEQIYPESGWVEHDPVEIWENTRTVMEEALDEADVDGSQLAALGVTNQRETTVLWDTETGEPVYNAVVWQDRRTNDRVERLREEGWGEEIREKTGLEVDAYFSATKLEWLLEHAEFEAVEDLAFGTVDSWLVYRMTGNHATDVTNASRTMLYDIHSLEWDEELLEEFAVPRSVLPEVKPSSAMYGYADVDGAEVPVAGVLGDQQAALFGQTCFEAGDAKNTYGTGSFLLMNTGDEPVESEHGLLTTVAYQTGDGEVSYALEGSIFVTGAAVEWLENVGLVDDVGETDEVARTVSDNGGVYFVPAFTGLGAPHWDGDARGTVIGLERSTERGHLVRAALEGIAYETRDVVEAMEADAGIGIDALRVDGGAVKNDLLCEIQADVLGSEIVRPEVEETTALGAAYAAGLTVGYWDGEDDLPDEECVDRVFAPEMDREEVDSKYERWSEAVERSKSWM